MSVDFNTIRFSDDWQKALHQASENRGMLGIKDPSGDLKIRYFEALDDMSAENFHKLSIQDTYALGNLILNNKTDQNEKSEIQADVKTLLDVESEKIHNTINKINASWINAIKWIAALTIILLPVAIMIELFQYSSRTEAKKNLAEVKNLETALLISETMKPIQNHEKKPTNPVAWYKNTLNELLKTPMPLAIDSKFTVPKVIAADFHRFDLLRLNGDDIFLNKDLKSPDNAYQKLLDTFGETADNAPVTNAVLLGLTQIQAVEIIGASVFYDTLNHQHVTTWSERCLEIDIIEGKVTIEMKGISYEFLADLSVEIPLDAHLVSRKIKMDIGQLREASKQQNPELLVDEDTKGEDRISDSLLFRENEVKTLEDLMVTPRIFNSDIKAFKIPTEDAYAILKNLP